jgi:hypothetical protein
MIETDALTAEGMSGGPYLSPDGVVVGIHQAGARIAAGFPHMTPIWGIRTSLEKHLPPIPQHRTSPSRPAAAAEAARRCGSEKLEELRSQREPFTYREGVRCGPDLKQRNAFVSYDVSSKRPGYAITGFVSHRDNVRHGWVGMLRYTRQDALNTMVVEVPVACDVSNLAGANEGWAETELSGYLRKIDDKDARKAIEQACAAGGR